MWELFHDRALLFQFAMPLAWAVSACASNSETARQTAVQNPPRRIDQPYPENLQGTVIEYKHDGNPSQIKRRSGTACHCESVAAWQRIAAAGANHPARLCAWHGTSRIARASRAPDCAGG